jgi:TolB-like protein/Tfp pilus assembly protein PilF/predicted Ser/Thr protein kinase
VPTDDELVSRVAASVLDGTPIDWAAIESSADSRRPVIAQLKVLAAVADVHRAPDQWGHLRLLERIGHGAFGDVYRAWDTRLDREVALKLVPADASRETSSIIHEGRLLARVRHPNVVTIYGAEQIDGVVGLWMEFVRGRTLKQLVDGGRRFTDAEVIGIGRSLSAALAGVHRAGLLHRDIKAQNVILAEDGRVVLMDFGTGRELADDSGTDLAGTPLYLAPELFEGALASVRSDIYSLGVLLFYLLTGSYPVRADSVRGVRLAHAHNVRTGVAAVRKDATLSPKLARIIERAIQARADDRYASAGALEADLEDLAAEQPAAARDRLTVRGIVALLSLATATAALIAIGALGTLRIRGSSSNPGGGRALLAVLPFDNLTGDPAQEYFSDGLTEEMIHQLGNVDPQHLGVIARTSVMRYKGNHEKRDQIERELGVQYVLDGSVRRSARHIRITAQLIRTSDRSHIWGREYDRELSDLLMLQAEIAQDVARQTSLTLEDMPDSRVRSTQARSIPYAAYDEYLKGRYFWNRRTREGFLDAIDAFENAIALDPNYARAYAGLADSYALMASYSLGNEFIPKARAAALRALELDEQLAEAHTSLALVVENHDWDWAKAEREYRRAIELDPNYATAHHWYGEFLGFQGRFDEAFAEFDRARQLDPLSLIIASDRGALLYFARQYDRSIEQFRQVLAVEPGFPRAFIIVNPLTENGMVAEALAEIERFRRYGEDAPWTWVAEVYVYRRWGRLPEARRALKHLEDVIHRIRVDPTPLLAPAYVGIDNTKALAYMERAYAEHSNALVLLKVSPDLDPIRGDPRFQDLLRRMHLAPGDGRQAP